MAGTPPKTYLFWPFWPSLTRRRRRRKSKKTKVEARSLWELRCRGIEWYRDRYASALYVLYRNYTCEKMQDGHI